MFTKEQYFNGYDYTPEQDATATNLVRIVGALIGYLITMGVRIQQNPKTGSIISGEKYGGFRPQQCPIGAKNSKHKVAAAVDIYDPTDEIDTYLLHKQDILSRFGVYMEHPSKTQGWCHLSIEPPPSKNHVFYP